MSGLSAKEGKCDTAYVCLVIYLITRGIAQIARNYEYSDKLHI